MDIVIASNNENKIKEIRDIIGDFFDNVFSLKDMKIKINIEETGKTFMENALLKAETICKMTNMPSLADDSGLEVMALNDEPGIYSARYAGEPCNDEKNNELLLQNLNGTLSRHARFRSAVALVYPDGTVLKTTGKTMGLILQSPRGENGFGYDPLFFSTELNMSFGDATPEEKNAVSHRAKALKELRYLLSKK